MSLRCSSICFFQLPRKGLKCVVTQYPLGLFDEEVEHRGVERGIEVVVVEEYLISAYGRLRRGFGIGERLHHELLDLRVPLLEAPLGVVLGCGLGALGAPAGDVPVAGGEPRFIYARLEYRQHSARRGVALAAEGFVDLLYNVGKRFIGNLRLGYRVAHQCVD